MFFCGYPREDFFRHLHFRKQVYFFWPENVSLCFGFKHHVSVLNT